MRIIIDPYKVYPVDRNTLYVTSELTYVKSRKVLLNYFVTGNKEYDNIYITDHPYNKWYNDLPECIIMVSPKTVLSEKFPTTPLPENLCDEDVIQLNLLDAGIEPSEKEIFKHFLDLVVPQKIDTPQLFRQASVLAEAVLVGKKVLRYRYLSETWEKKINIALSTHSMEIRLIFQPIALRDESYCLMLTKGLYGARSDVFRRHWLEDVTLEFHKRSIPLAALEGFLLYSAKTLKINERNECVLERFFEENLRAGTIGLANLSGFYSAELNALLTIGKKIDNATRNELAEKFANVIDDKQLAALNSLILPSLPEFPSLTGLAIGQQAEVLKQWAVKSFIPFKFYYDEADVRDIDALSLIDQNAELFGDWLFANLDGILDDDSIYTNIDIVKNIREQIKDQSNVIWLVIDGFAAQYTSVLELILKENGINRIQTSWSFATLPTITEVAVPITVSGKYSNAIPDIDLLNRSELLKKAFPGKVTIYSSKPADFQSNLNKPFDICCLHVHDIDREMHKNDGDFYHGRTQEIERYLNKYIHVVADIIRKNPERRINLFISTDHGATKCLANAQMIKNPKLDELALSRPHERCIPLTEELAKENWERSDTYMLNKTMSRNKFDWVIARGYKYFGRNDSGYRHGGLTPEEVVVPVITGQILQLDAIKLSVRPIGLTEFRFGKTEKNFKFRIGNADVNNILISSVSILEEKDTSFDLPLQIHSNAEADLTGIIKLHPRLKSQAKAGVLRLNLGIKYNSLGIQYEDVLPIDILTEKDEFEIDFL